MVADVMLVAIGPDGEAALPPGFQHGQAFDFVLVVVLHNANLQRHHALKQDVLSRRDTLQQRIGRDGYYSSGLQRMGELKPN